MQDEQAVAGTTENVIWPPQPSGQPQPEKPQQSWWADLFAVPEGESSSQEVSRWWEARRLTYNKLVFGLGIPSFFLYLFFLITSGQLPPGEDAIEPLSILFAPVMVPLMVNICYTFGRIVELLWRVMSGDKTRKSGRFLMRLGIGFTLFVVFFPTVMWGLIWFWHIIVLGSKH